MEWTSPWGIGFPGWHIECSALSLKFLGKERDIHCGGADHINVHHTNEIAQSEAATGEKYFNYWLHGAFLNISGGKKMAKSDNNFLTLEHAIIKKNLHPLAYRYAAAQVHYRKPMEYSEDSFKQSQNAWKNLLKQIAL
jgi:cysteinyl-tRNA synthetase